MLATGNVFFSRYFPSFWGYVYRSMSLIWGEGKPIRLVLAPEGCAGLLSRRITEHRVHMRPAFPSDPCQRAKPLWAEM